ncbi:hypothetical protein [Enterobacter asburiae]|uniref:hypothetical protein n=1 Tax=Enterobacter asburiae TaxID=61645 RepID=UPI003BC7D0C1
MDASLNYAIQRIVELETMLLVPEVPETVWPVEVESIFSQFYRAVNLPPHHQRRLKHHINRMWLDRVPVPSIIEAAKLLCEAMEKYA